MADLSRYLIAQEQDYETALKEIRAGYKRSHWMWYIFPQIIGLGQSRTSIYYSLQNLEDARAYLADPVLGSRMNEICDALRGLESSDASYIFGSPDDMKLKSSMTMFREACPENDRFQKVLDKFFEGECDRRTIELISWRS